MIVVLLIIQSWTAYLDTSLQYIGLNQADLTFRNDYTVRDPYRFAIVDSLLSHPINASTFVTTLDSIFWNCSENYLIPHLCSWYGLRIRMKKTNFEEVCAHAAQDIVHAFSETPSELGDVVEELTTFSPDLTTSIDEDKARERHQDSLVQYMKENAATVDYERLFQAGVNLLFAATHYEVWLNDISLQGPYRMPGVEGTILYSANYEWGDIVIGDTGANHYTQEFTVVIDLGGDDVYSCKEPDMISIIIDKAGDDQYIGGDHTIGAGVWAVSIVIDEQGDDSYKAGSYSLGCGVFGIGILIDKTGNDTYFGDTFTQGAGGFGIGVLKDGTGNDVYEGALYAQGFASTYGIGILGDETGNDMFIIREKYIDEIRYLDHYLSLSQGFAMGFRPDLSAGIGMLLDRAGNDYYLGDIFAQGSSYWYGIGGIVESGGNDTYVAYQYAQGAGTHITIGVLVDKAGNDNYVSKGVSQGCGHDLALGMLLDHAGDDSYVAFDLSQGAGNANGIGILIDEKGDDSYSVKRSHNTQGYGNFRREYGSVGVLIDIRGDDIYRNGENSCVWTSGKYGVGMDYE